MQNSAKNPPWARSNVNSNMSGMNPQVMDPNAMAMSQQGMMPFQQPFNHNMMGGQGGMPMQMGGQMPMNQMAQGQMYPGNVVAYPTPRGMNPGMYQNNQPNQNQPSNNEQRVFTGTVTKTHNDFGFVDHDVFYQTSVVAKGVIPKVNDRVLVEATYNPNMPFKWNATRVQVLPRNGPTGKQQQQQPKGPGNYNAVPPPAAKKNVPNRRDDRPDRPPRREDRKRSRSRSRSRSPVRDRRESRRRDSPARKRPSVREPSPPKYTVRVPRMPLDIAQVDVPGLSQRYNNLYVPSDFFHAKVRWCETFPPQNPFALNNSSSYHIMSKEAENPLPNDAVLEPSDADYRYSAKVMLISLPTLETIYQKCGLTKSDDKDKRSSSKNAMHPTRLIKFLVGHKSKGGDNFAIGGPWSPSLDGEDPQSDPTVLVRTAIRTCKALTGIDLSACTQWYRMVEFCYWRESSGGSSKSRLETVVLFLPDVWSAERRADWPELQERYRAAADAALQRLAQPPPPLAATVAPAAAPAKADAPLIEKSSEEKSADDSTITIDENDDDEDKPEPTHYSQLDMKTIKVEQLRQELRARNVSCKGLRPALVSRLSKLVKAEEEKDKKSDDVMVVEDDDETEKTETKDAEPAKVNKDEGQEKKEEVKVEEKKEDEKKKEKTEKEIEEEKKKLEKEKQHIRARYELPGAPHVLVHPHPTAKGGKFGCSTATLSLLLDYRITDNKEHSFELFVFAELFNEMLMRDFGFYIYKTLYTLPEKPEEIKEKSVDKDKASEKKDEKEKEKDKDKKDDKKDDKRDDKRDSRRRDRRDSHSDDERSSSPKSKSRGVDLPPDPYLLLSLIYFDTTRCSYVAKRDLQSLFMSLGLQLSRSQIRSVLEKVCVKESFNYKPLVQAIRELAAGADPCQDLPLDMAPPPGAPAPAAPAPAPAAAEVPEHIAELELAIATGNRELLRALSNTKKSDDEDKSTGTKEIPEGGMVLYKSRLVDVGATLAALSRSEAIRAKLETALSVEKQKARALRDAAAKGQAASKSSESQLTTVSEQLTAAKNRIVSLTASSKIFHSALKTIQAKVDAVVNIKFEEDDDVVEIVNGPTKVEKKEPKQEVKEPKPESKHPEKEEERNTPAPEKSDKIEESAEESTTQENMDLDDKE